MNIDETKKVSVTGGMARATKTAARVCKGCGLKIPVYPGRYPSKCPECGRTLDTPTMDEQIELVQAGIPPADVVKMAHPTVVRMAGVLDDGIAKGNAMIDSGIDMLREQDPISDIERAVRGAAGKVRAAKSHVKSKAGEVKKHAQAVIASRRKQKKDKEEREKEKRKRERERKAKETEREKKKESIEERHNYYFLKHGWNIITPGREIEAPDGGLMWAETQDNLTFWIKSDSLVADLPVSEQNRVHESFVQYVKDTTGMDYYMRESIKEGKLRTTLTMQENSIFDSINKHIAEDGYADLSRVARDFKANAIAVYNLVKENQEKLGLILGGNGYKVYPAKQKENIND